MRGQNPKVRKHMDRFSWRSVPWMHHCDPGNIEHLYLVTFTLQQLFTLWPLTRSFHWIEALTNAKMEFGLCFWKVSRLECHVKNGGICLAARRQDVNKLASGVTNLLSTSYYGDWQRCRKLYTGFWNKSCLTEDIHSIPDTEDQRLAHTIKTRQQVCSTTPQNIH